MLSSRPHTAPCSRSCRQSAAACCEHSMCWEPQQLACTCPPVILPVNLADAVGFGNSCRSASPELLHPSKCRLPHPGLPEPQCQPRLLPQRSQQQWRHWYEPAAAPFPMLIISFLETLQRTLACPVTRLNYHAACGSAQPSHVLLRSCQLPLKGRAARGRTDALGTLYVAAERLSLVRPCEPT